MDTRRFQTDASRHRKTCIAHSSYRQTFISRASYHTPPDAAGSQGEEDEEDLTDIFRSFALAPRPAYAGALVQATRPVRETLHRGVVIARDGALNRRGPCLIIRHLWYRTAVSLHAHVEFSM
jgi:hypothetical protein